MRLEDKVRFLMAQAGQGVLGELDRPQQHVQPVARVGAAPVLARVNGDHAVNARLPEDVDRRHADIPTIDEQMGAVIKRRQDARQRRAGIDGIDRVAACLDDHVAGQDIRCGDMDRHAALLEIPVPGQLREDTAAPGDGILAGAPAVIDVAQLLPGDVEIPQPRHDARAVESRHDREARHVHGDEVVIPVVVQRIGRADNGAHGIAGNRARIIAEMVQRPQHAGMGHAARAAAGEDQSELVGHAHHPQREIMSYTSFRPVGASGAAQCALRHSATPRRGAAGRTPE